MSVRPSPSTIATSSAALRQQTLLKALGSRGPSIQEVAWGLLTRELKALYPNLDLNPDTTLAVTPIWTFVEDELFCQDMAYEPLTQALLRQFLEKTQANYVEGEHFLARAPLAQTPVHLDVSIERVADLLNDLAGVFSVEFKEQQLAFWNASSLGAPHWHELSDGLRRAMHVEPFGDWNADACAIAQAVGAWPDKQQRDIHHPEMAGIKVCLIDIDQSGQVQPTHLLLIGAAVLAGRYRERDVLLMYTVEYGYEAFDSMQALSEQILQRLSPTQMSQPLTWRLVEPEGSFFDHMAWALVDLQLRTIETFDLTQATQAALSVDPSRTSAAHTVEQARTNKLRAAIPDWLREASVQDLNAYSSHLIDLSVLRNTAHSDLFEIPSINAFAQQKMCEAIIADKATHGADTLALDTLRITRTESFTVGVFVLPNPLDRHTQTLGEYALSNSPAYMASIHFTHGQSVPDWLTPQYLTGIAEQVNIGEAYPRLIKSKLLDDPVQAPLQKQMYQRQLRSLLPLLALECKVRQLGDVDEQGYGYINKLLHPSQDSRRPIVVRPLTLYPQHRMSSANDNVLNMFVIGPRSPDDGPCLLYRPLMERPLLQFQSFQNLLYAVHQPGELRDSVLAWLPNRALSFNYSQYVFPVGLPSPWLAVQNLSEPLNLLEWSGPVYLLTTELTGDVFAAFYDANTQAMIELADRQSLSNAERRWALLEDSGWAVFNAASGFLNGYAGAAVWVWQTINEIQQGLDAHQHGNTLVEWTRVGDVLMALSMLLIHHANQRRQTGTSTETLIALEPATPPAKPVLTVLPTVSAEGSLPHSEYATIAIDGSVPRRTPEQLERFLDTLKVTPPTLDDPQLSAVASSNIPPLYQLHDKAFAQVGQRWFEVLEDADEHILIRNPQHPARSGPRLVHHDNQAWHINTELRLLGSGRSLKSQLRASRLAKTQRRQVLEDQLKTLREQEAAAQQVLNSAREQFTSGQDPSSEQRYMDQLDVLATLYQQSLSQLQAWREAGGTLGYAQELFRLSAEHHKHLNLWLAVQRNRYVAAMNQVRLSLNDESVERPALLADITRMTELGNTITPRLSGLSQSLELLPAVGAAGIIAAERLSALGPRFTQWDFKTNEISTMFEFCVQEQAAADMEKARDAVGFVVERAAQVSKELALMVRETPVRTAPEERGERLLTIVDEYVSVSQRIDELPGDFPELVVPDQLLHLKTLVGEFQGLAQTTLTQLLAETEQPTSKAEKPGVAGPSRSRPRVSISKTRPRDLPVKPSDVPVQEPLGMIQPRTARPVIPSNDYTEAVGVALELSMDINGFIQRTQQDALRPKRVPADMQDILEQQATRLEQAADIIDRLDADAQRQNKRLPIALLPTELRDGATRMRRAGIALRAKLLKARKPRQADFQWLLEHGQVRLVRNAVGRIKTRQYQDYFQEYQILDTANHDQPLWLAHFHYPTLTTPASRFSAAHLKIADQHLQQFSDEIRQALSTRTPWDNHLRKLTDPLLQAECLKLEPTAS
ncbi:MAG: hypothetical protein ACK418_17975 [Pseudomonas sp.]|uniref:hypothetical protein n=1 Tax=Pseudomonas sp. TaxID=306 RepID=UPI00391B3BDA